MSQIGVLKAEIEYLKAQCNPVDTDSLVTLSDCASVVTVTKLGKELAVMSGKMSALQAPPDEVRTEKPAMQINNVKDAKDKLKSFAGLNLLKVNPGV